MPERPVRVRLAPSPTGFVHIGNVRTALYGWLFARHHHGTFVLRVEDTDRARLVPGSIENVYAVLCALGLTPDEGVRVEDGQVIDEGPYAPYIQSARRERHAAYAEELIKRGAAYRCFCSKERLATLSAEQQATHQSVMYDRHCRSLSIDEAEHRHAAGESHVIRIVIPEHGSITCTDVIRGLFVVDWQQVEDAVLLKSDGFPTYHLASVCDDHDMEITHVIRGEEWLSSLPKHLLLYQAFAWNPPFFAHLPLLLNPDRSKLSKRQGDVAVEDYLKHGYLPDALVNFLALLGWNPTGDREVYTRDELIAAFDLTSINRSGAVMNIEKLKWMNAQYLKQLTEAAYLAHCLAWVSECSSDRAFVERLCMIVRERVQIFEDLPALIQPLCQESLTYDRAMLAWKKQSTDEVRMRLQDVRTVLTEWNANVYTSATMIEQTMRSYMIEKGWQAGETLWPLRVALSGQQQSPSPFELLYACGRERALARIDAALAAMAY